MNVNTLRPQNLFAGLLRHKNTLVWRALSCRFEQDDAGGDRYIQAFRGSLHGNCSGWYPRRHLIGRQPG